MRAILPVDASSRTPAALSPWLAVVGLAAAYLLVHSQALASMAGMWDRNPMYSYGYLIAPISLFMIWSRRRTLAQRELRPALVGGLAVLVAWLGLMIVGRMGSVMLFEQLCVPLALVGLTLLLFGWSTLAAVWVPLAYLLLMVPFWDALLEPLHVPFQNLSANIGARLLELAGIPAHRDGTFIILPTIRLEVARACSGANYLVSVVALGIPLGYVGLRTPWRRVVLLLCGLIIAAFANSLRVALIGFLVTADPTTPLHGPGHVLHGLFAAGVGDIALFIALWWLGRGEAAGPPRRPAEEPPAARSPSPAFFVRGAMLGGVIFVLAFALLQARVVATVPLAASLDALPREVGHWTADEFAEPAWPRWWPTTDAGLRRRYHAGGLRADVYVGYVGLQQHGRELITPRAEALHQAAQPVTIAASNGRLIVANVAVVGERQERRLTLFWYEVNGRTVGSQTAVKIRTAWNAVVHRQTAGAVIAVIMEAPPDTDVGDLRVRLDGFAVALDGALRVALPVSGEAGPTAVARRENLRP